MSDAPIDYEQKFQDLMGKSVALAFAAAVEIEKPLREIRDQITTK